VYVEQRNELANEKGERERERERETERKRERERATHQWQKPGLAWSADSS
jgi:hypothetical protein